MREKCFSGKLLVLLITFTHKHREVKVKIIHVMIYSYILGTTLCCGFVFNRFPEKTNTFI